MTRAETSPGRVRQIPRMAGSLIRFAAFLGAIALAAVAGLAILRRNEKIPVAAFALAVPLIVGADLFLNGREFWHFQAPAREGLYREDALVARVKQTPLPYRVLDLSAPMGAPAYPINVLMGHDVPQVLGYFGFELQKYVSDQMYYVPVVTPVEFAARQNYLKGVVNDSGPTTYAVGTEGALTNWLDQAT